MKRHIFVLAAVLGCVLAGPAQSGWWSSLFGGGRSEEERLHKALARAPYLQQASSTGITVVWRTKWPTQAGLTYGLAPGALTERVPADHLLITADLGGDCDPETDELLPPETPSVQVEARLEGLAPGTTYYYAIWDGAKRLAGDDEHHAFRTYPAADAETAVRVWAFGCSGSGDDNARAVHRAARSLVQAEQKPIDLWLHMGDLAYYDGHDSDFQRKFFDIYRPTLRQIVCWTAQGNHDGHKASTRVERGPYYDAFVLPEAGESGGVPSGTESFYSFDYGRVHFISLNSYQEDRTAKGRMARWLVKDLAAARGRSDWIIAFWHDPPFSKGSHDSDTEPRLIQMREQILPILEKGGVDLVLNAHSHGYERSMLVRGPFASPTVSKGAVLNDGDGDPNGDGEYLKPEGTVPEAGLVAVVAGTGGGVLGGTGTHRLMRRTHRGFGSVLIDIEKQRLVSRFVSDQGEVLDTFALVKRGREIAAPVEDPWVPLGPVLKPGVATFLDQMPVSIESSTGWSAEQIHYTLDGSEPTMMAAFYNEPFAVTNDVLVRARAWNVMRGHVTPFSETRFVRYQGPVLPAVPMDSARLAPGLRWLSYTGEWAVLPNFDALRPAAEGASPEVNPLVSGGTDQFGLSFRGYFLAPEREAYTFALESDDGSRLVVGGQVVVDNDGLHGKVTKEGVIALEKGLHEVRLDYFDSQYGETLNVRVAMPDMEWTDGAGELWFHEAEEPAGAGR